MLSLPVISSFFLVARIAFWLVPVSPLSVFLFLLPYFAESVLSLGIYSGNPAGIDMLPATAAQALTFLLPMLATALAVVGRSHSRASESAA